MTGPGPGPGACPAWCEAAPDHLKTDADGLGGCHLAVIEQIDLPAIGGWRTASSLQVDVRQYLGRDRPRQPMVHWAATANDVGSPLTAEEAHALACAIERAADAFAAGLALVEPGLQVVRRWRSDKLIATGPADGDVSVYGVLARIDRPASGAAR